jgi:hypothetical protein
MNKSFFFYSFDTEALNKSHIGNIENEISNTNTFSNVFQNSLDTKSNIGIQQLYIIGLYDNMPKNNILNILKKYLPTNLYNRIVKYVTSDLNNKSHINFTYFQHKVSKIDLVKCSSELLHVLDNCSSSDKNVSTFHIATNNQDNKITEPNHKNTIDLVYSFVLHIYKRNILATVVKYILLLNFINLLKTSKLIPQKRGIFFLIYKRIEEILFECNLLSFNGSNYDNYLICNSLIIIQSILKQKIKIFKKGASISTIILINKYNLNKSLKHTLIPKKNVKKKNTNHLWMMKLYFKDIRNLVSANVSLDKLGKLFNLPVSKLCFPYEQATSIKKIKNITSLCPTNELFWKDSFFNKSISLESRLYAQSIYEQNKFKNLYEFSEYYLKQDCHLLHEIVLTLFNSYLKDSINIFLRRNYSQSSLAYQQFFIIEPSKQINNTLAPKKINNSFYNYLIKQAVTGGLCTSFVHGKVDKSTIINEHFNYILNPNLDFQQWPNFSTIDFGTKSFNKTPSGILTLDIRSLYPSAALKSLPVNIPLLFSRFTNKDHLKVDKADYLSLNLNMYCKNVQIEGAHEKDMFKLVSRIPKGYFEFYSLCHYLEQLPKDIKIIRFQSYFTALGQLYFLNYPVDGFLSYKDQFNNMHIQILQCNSTYFHGHRDSCYIKNTHSESILAQKSLAIKNNIENMCTHLINHFDLKQTFIEYIEIFNCDFPKHIVPKKKDFLFSYSKNYSYNSFLNSIYENKLTGFLVVKNLEIKKNNQNPMFGFVIQKIEYDSKILSPYTQHLLKNFCNSKRVISVHKSKSFMVISTEYFNWLRIHFGFEHVPDIYHALLFQLTDYLKPYIESKLNIRKSLKNQIKNETNPVLKQNFEIQAELIKLMLNSCYGFTLCNLTSNKFKQFENRTFTPKNKRNIVSCIQFQKNVFLVEKNKCTLEPFQTLLGHVGCYILFHSKIILLKRLYFLLKYLNPQKAQLLYMDTDSAHFLLQNKSIANNVDITLQKEFLSQFNDHFETGNKVSGIWVEEGFFNTAEYLGEKCYRLYNDYNSEYITHMKGLNQNFQTQYHEQNINIKENPFIAFNFFFKSPDFLIFKSHMSKNLFSNFVPVKRYFVSCTGSLPLKP